MSGAERSWLGAWVQLQSMLRALQAAPQIHDSLVEVRGPAGTRAFMFLKRTIQLPDNARYVDRSLIIPR